MEKKCNQIGIIDKKGYWQANRVYSGNCCPTLLSRDFKDPIKVIKRIRKYDETKRNDSARTNG